MGALDINKFSVNGGTNVGTTKIPLLGGSMPGSKAGGAALDSKRKSASKAKDAADQSYMEGYKTALLDLLYLDGGQPDQPDPYGGLDPSLQQFTSPDAMDGLPPMQDPYAGVPIQQMTPPPMGALPPPGM